MLRSWSKCCWRVHSCFASRTVIAGFAAKNLCGIRVKPNRWVGITSSRRYPAFDPNRSSSRGADVSSGLRRAQRKLPNYFLRNRFSLKRLFQRYPLRDFVEVGGLMAYSIDLLDTYRRFANLIDKILRGANPGDIPFYQPTRYELSINLKTAKALGLEMPAMMLGRADQVIE